MNKRILAGIVSFNPDLELLERNMKALENQGCQILLVDNGSANNGDIQAVADDHGAIFISNYENRGLAAALNQILDYAADSQYEWYLTMDQDSIVSPSLVEDLLGHAEDADGILCPYLLNNSKMSVSEFEQLHLPAFREIEDPLGCITSASLNRTAAAREIGGYDERLFIDCIDVDFNIRMMNAGYRIRQSGNSYLIQQMGEGRVIPFFDGLYRLTHLNVFRRLSVSPVYSNLRLYYISRNSSYIQKKYQEKAGPRMQKKWMNAQFLYYCLTYPKSRKRSEMIASWKKGRKDAPLLLEETEC